MMQGLIPVADGWLSQKFDKAKHKGIDIGWHDVEHCDVRAWNDGNVFAWGADAAGAWFIVLKHDNGQLSGYWHLHQCPTVKTGQRVKKGEKIGLRGNTGYSGGTHLHFLLTDDFNPQKYNYNVMLAHTIDPLPNLYRLATDIGFVAGVDGINLTDLPLETVQIDPEALKKVTNEAIKELLVKVYGEIGYDVKNFKITYTLKEK